MATINNRVMINKFLFSEFHALMPLGYWLNFVKKIYALKK